LTAQGGRQKSLLATPYCAKDERILYSFFETGRGETVFTCFVKQAELDTAVKEFRKIRATIKAP
jgi:hypothetical protein